MRASECAGITGVAYEQQAIWLLSHGMPVRLLKCHACCAPLGAVCFLLKSLIQPPSCFDQLIQGSLAVTVVMLPQLNLKPGIRNMSLP
jgi:transcriptional regulator of nitric oxide reductase